MTESEFGQGISESLLFWVLVGVISLVPAGMLIAKHWSSLSQAMRAAAMSPFIGLLFIWLDLRLDKAWIKGIGIVFILVGWLLAIREQNRQLLESEGEGESMDAFALYQRSKYYLAIALFMAILLSIIFLLKHLHLLR